MSFWDEKEAKGLFKKVLFYDIIIEKSRIKLLINIELMDELALYDELSIEKMSKGFKRYARSDRIEIKDSKDPLVQMEVSKSNIKDLFKDLLDEIKGCNYQITVKVLFEQTQWKWGHKICSCLF